MSQHVMGAADPGPAPRLPGVVLAVFVAAMGLVGAAFGAAVGRSTARYCLEGKQEFCQRQDYFVPAVVGAAVGVLLITAVLPLWRHEAVTAGMASVGFVAVLAGLGDVVAGLVLALFVAWGPGSAVTAVIAAALVAGTAACLTARRGAVAVTVACLGVAAVAVTVAISLEVTAWPLAPAASLWVAAVAGAWAGRRRHPACREAIRGGPSSG